MHGLQKAFEKAFGLVFETGGHGDWLGYRMAAAQADFFRQGQIRMWAIAFCIMAIAFILLSWKWQNTDSDRCERKASFLSIG